MADLSSSVREAVSRHEGLAQLAQQSCRFAEESLAAIQNVPGVREIRTKLDEMVEDPFVDPLSEVKTVSENAMQPTTPKRMAVPDETGQCPVCLGKLGGADESVSRTKLQQLKTDWRHEWTTQLKQELVALGQKTGKINPRVAGSIATVNEHTRTSSVSNTDDLADLISEVMTTKSWDDDGGASSSFEMRSISSFRRSTPSSDLTNKLQRLQTRYDSSQKRMQILIEEITDLKKENLELQEDVPRLRDRFAKARAAPSMQIESLQRECEDLRYLAAQATENYDGLNVSYRKLQSKRQSERERAEIVDQELTLLRGRVELKSLEIEKLGSSAATTAIEIARLQALEVRYNDLIQATGGVVAERRPYPDIRLSSSVPNPKHPTTKQLTLLELPPQNWMFLFQLIITFQDGEPYICVAQACNWDFARHGNSSIGGYLNALHDLIDANAPVKVENNFKFHQDIVLLFENYPTFGFIFDEVLREMVARVRKVNLECVERFRVGFAGIKMHQGLTMFDYTSFRFVKRSALHSGELYVSLNVSWIDYADKIMFGLTEE